MWDLHPFDQVNKERARPHGGARHRGALVRVFASEQVQTSAAGDQGDAVGDCGRREVSEEAGENAGQEHPARASERPRQTSAALAAAGLFFLVLTANLCFPTPQGPADNGDFFRIINEFSTGPQGYEYSLPGGGADDDWRYFTYYHRYWLLERPDDTSFKVPCSSSLLFLPGRFLDANAPPGYFDLTFNTFVLIAALATAMFLLLRLLPPMASLGLGVLASLILADAGVASYLNSFYQESGGYFFTVLLLCALGWWWFRNSWPSLLALLGTAVLAMASKRPLTVAVAVVVVVATGVAVVLARFQKRELVRFVLAVAVVVVTGLTVNRVSSLPLHSKVYCYSAIFGGMLPSLGEGEQVAFLREVGLPESFAAFSGTIPHGPGTPFADEHVQAAMSGAVQARAVVAFVTHYPGGLFRLLRRVGEAAGEYEVPYFGYRGPEYSSASQDLGGLHWWTELRAGVLGGWIGYIVGALLTAILFVFRAHGSARRWLVKLRWGAVAFYLASLTQILIVALGDGGVSLPKALYFANLTLDIQFLLAIAAIGVVFLPRVGRLYGVTPAWAGRTKESGQ